LRAHDLALARVERPREVEDRRRFGELPMSCRIATSSSSPAGGGSPAVPFHSRFRVAASISALFAPMPAQDETQARYAHRIALLLSSRHAHLADDNRSPAMRGFRGSRGAVR
jgi:hypothetical protein